ncbi:MAG: chloramphenicol acetyltransferase [Calditrichaeota bacterium]|nr:MAG: chloramphenicol acetyltransferase [Calditrichota bacterium]
MQKIDIENWHRKDYFEFFRHYDDPSFSLTADVDVTKLYQLIKEQNASFFLASLYLCQKAVNQIEAFKYRIRGKKIILHDRIDVGSTVLNEDNSFSFCYFKYVEPFRDFAGAANLQMQLLKEKQQKLNPQDDRDDLIHYTIIPWFSFRSFKHPRKNFQANSIPKIAFGKFTRETKMQMPISIDAHHGLMDGWHVGQFYQKFQQLLDSPAKHL